MENSKSSYRETVYLAVGEAVVTALTVLGFFISHLALGTDFGIVVLTGAVLGFAVIVLNFFFLSLSVNRAVDAYLEERGSRQMNEEEAARFTTDHSAKIQNSVKISYIVRTVTMVATLAVAFITSWFNPLATVIPMLAFRPILSLAEIIRKKGEPQPDTSKFIHYSDEDDVEEEKESD